MRTVDEVHGFVPEGKLMYICCDAPVFHLRGYALPVPMNSLREIKINIIVSTAEGFMPASDIKNLITRNNSEYLNHFIVVIRWIYLAKKVRGSLVQDGSPGEYITYYIGTGNDNSNKGIIAVYEEVP